MSDSSGSQVFARRVGRFSSATMVSRILGYVRDASVAHFFGGTLITDVFYTAFRASNLLRRLLGEGALSSAFVPVFSKSLKTDSKEEAQDFLNALFTSLIVILFVLTCAGVLFAPQITHVIAPGFRSDPAKFEMTVTLTRWMFPFFFFISLAAFLSGVLNSLKHFFLPAVAPAMLSVAEIVYLFLIMRHFPPEIQIVGLAVSVVAGGAAHFLVQTPSLFREKFRLGFRWDWGHPRSARVGKLMLPAVFGLSVDQINAFVNTICGTFLVHGSVTALYNSNRLMQLPLALFGVAAATVTLAALSDHSAEKNVQRFGETLGASLRMVVFIIIPATAGLMILARPIVKLLFEHGEFTAFATDLTTHALWGYTSGLLAYSCVKILANAFYALQEPRVPVRVAAFCMVVNVVLSVLLMRPLGVGGLAAAAAFSSWINAIWLFVKIRDRIGGSIETKEILKTGLKSLFCTLVMSVFLFWISTKASFLGEIAHPLLGVVLGAAIFIGCAFALRMPEIRTILDMTGLKENIED